MSPEVQIVFMVAAGTLCELIAWRFSVGLFVGDGSFKRFTEIDLKALTENFCTRVLGALRQRELITDDDVRQISSQEHTGFSVWVGEPFSDGESERFVARYVERGPIFEHF